MLEEAREDHKENDAQHMRRGCEMPLEAASLKTLLIYRRIRFVCNKHVLLLHRPWRWWYYEASRLKGIRTLSRVPIAHHERQMNTPNSKL
jgi:hypothetical protein